MEEKYNNVIYGWMHHSRLRKLLFEEEKKTKKTPPTAEVTLKLIIHTK